MSLDREVEGDHDSRGRVTGRPPDGEQKILHGQVGDNPDPSWERASSFVNSLNGHGKALRIYETQAAVSTANKPSPKEQGSAGWVIDNSSQHGVQQ